VDGSVVLEVLGKSRELVHKTGPAPAP